MATTKIDIIAKKKKTLIAIEVKYRKKVNDGLYAITPTKGCR
mgnify:CR=1 FL=1